MISFGKYSKTIAALVGAVITWVTVVTQSAPSGVTAAEWVAGGVLAATALGVYGVTNAE